MALQLTAGKPLATVHHHDIEPPMPTDGSEASQGAQTKDARGRGWAVVIYGLLLGSIMAVVTAPIAALLAHWRGHHCAPWVASHLRFQARTVWFGLLACLAALAIWQGLGHLGTPPLAAWLFGYLFFTVLLIWLVGRCAVGIHRLTANRPVERPDSLAFGVPLSRP